MPNVFKIAFYFERYLVNVKVIKITSDCYVQPLAILIIQKELGLVPSAPTDVQAEWNTRPNTPDNHFANLLLPALKAILTSQKHITRYFTSKEARDKEMDNLVKQ